MRGIIYCQKLEIGVNQLKEIVNLYNSVGIHLFKKVAMGNRYEKALAVKFNNGDEWTVVQNVMGHRCNVIYIL